MQFAVRERHQPVERPVLAPRPGLQQHGEIVRVLLQAIACIGRLLCHNSGYITSLIKSKTYDTPSWIRSNGSAPSSPRAQDFSSTVRLSAFSSKPSPASGDGLEENADNLT